MTARELARKLDRIETEIRSLRVGVTELWRRVRELDRRIPPAGDDLEGGAEATKGGPHG